MTKQTLPPMAKRDAQRLKGQAHALKPVVLLGSKGLTPAVLTEIELALETHELIKVKLAGLEKEERESAAREISEHCQAYFLQLLGSILTLYRQRQED